MRGGIVEYSTMIGRGTPAGSIWHERTWSFVKRDFDRVPLADNPEYTTSAVSAVLHGYSIM